MNGRRLKNRFGHHNPSVFTRGWHLRHLDEHWGKCLQSNEKNLLLENFLERDMSLKFQVPSIGYTSVATWWFCLVNNDHIKTPGSVQTPHFCSQSIYIGLVSNACFLSVT